MAKLAMTETGSQKVRGSNPLSSINSESLFLGTFCPLFPFIDH